MNSLDWIRSLFRHMEWADAKTWHSIMACGAAQEDDYVRTRLSHLHVVQRVFFRAWHGEKPAGADHEMKLAELLPWAIEYHVLAGQYLDHLKPAVLEDEVILPWSAGAQERLGHPVSHPNLFETMLQVVTHSTYHRAQVAARLKELGGTTEITDYILWVWHGRPAAMWPALAV